MIPIMRDEASAPFYDGTRRGELLVRLCHTCGAVSAPSAVQCHRCASTDLGWTAASGDATLVSWAVPRTRDGALVAIAAVVQLTEGPWLRARIVDTPTARLAPGLALTVRFLAPEAPSDGETGESVPAFAMAER